MFLHHALNPLRALTSSSVQEPASLSKMDATKIYLKSSGYNDAQIADWESDVNAQAAADAKAEADAKAADQAEADAREAIELAQAATVHERIKRRAANKLNALQNPDQLMLDGSNSDTRTRLVSQVHGSHNHSAVQESVEIEFVMGAG